MIICSKGAEKYFRRGLRLNWPEGAVSRESIRAVNKLDRLKVTFPHFFFFFGEPVGCVVGYQANFYGVTNNAASCRIWYLNM